MSVSQQYVGPKTAQPEQLSDVIALSDLVFRGGPPGRGSMGSQYPAVFDPRKLEQLRIIERGGKCVSLVATLVSDVVLLGCSVRLSAIGAVCTHPDHRGQDLAGRLVADAVQRSLAAGACLMLISGGRSLYTRRGACSCGRFCAYEATREALPAGEPGLTVSRLTGEDAAAALRLYEAEPIRYRRTVEEYVTQIGCNWTENRPGVSYLMARAGRPVAVMSVNRRRVGKDSPEEILGVCEMAGSRQAVLAGLRSALEESGMQRAAIHAYESDCAMRDACARLGAAPTVRRFVGTVKLLDARRLWQSFAPLLIERIGPEALAAIRLSSEADELQIHTLAFAAGADQVKLQGAPQIMAALFGDKELDGLAGLSGELAQTLRRALPLPLPTYGLNYV